jgi:hypothetical protein
VCGSPAHRVFDETFRAAGRFVAPDMVWLPGSTSPALRRLLGVVTEMAAVPDLAEAG